MLASHTQIASERCCMSKSCYNASCKKKKIISMYQDFLRGQYVAYHDCGLRHYSFTARFGRSSIIFCTIWMHEFKKVKQNAVQDLREML